MVSPLSFKDKMIKIEKVWAFKKNLKSKENFYPWWDNKIKRGTIEESQDRKLSVKNS